MSTTVTYKGSTLTTVNNQTRVLETGGTWLEDDITLTDVTQGGITPTGTKQINISQIGTVTEEVTNYASAQITVNVPSSGPSQTQHTIYFEFEDNTNMTITAYWDGTFISDAIRATTPTTYNNKTVTLAQLDGTTWYSYDPSAFPLNTQLIDYSKCVANKAIEQDGSVIEQEWYYVSDYTRVDHSMTFSYKAGIWTYIGLYDSNKAFVDTIYVHSDGTVDPNDGNLATGTLNGSKMNSNVAYVRLSSIGTTSDEMSLIRTA